MEYKYAWDDVELLNLQNEVANVAKDNGNIEVVRVRHLSAHISFLYQRVGLGRKVICTLIPITCVFCHSIHQAASYWFSVPCPLTFSVIEGHVSLAPLWLHHCSLLQPATEVENS